MSMRFNIFPDSSCEEDCDFEDGKSQIWVLEGIQMKKNLCNQRLLVHLGRVVFNITDCQQCT